MSFKEVRATPRVDYYCHVSMMECSDIENPTVISVTREEFLADLDEAGIEKAVILSDSRTSPEHVSAFVRQVRARNHRREHSAPPAKK